MQESDSAAHEDVRQFLSLEAEVDDDESEDEHEEEDDDDFIQDEPLIADRRRSHQLLLHETARVHGDAEWDALLERARRRAGASTGNSDDHDAPQIEIPLDPLVGEARLWKVKVKPGREETLAFLLMEKIVRSGSLGSTVKSIIGRVSQPGWIVVEAAKSSDVQEVCQGISDVFWQYIQVIEPNDAPSCLKEAISYTPLRPSWLRLTKHPYRGDIAYVEDFDVWGVKVLVVPRINLQPRTTTQHGKRKRTQAASPALRPKTRLSRPQPALFDVDKVRQVWGSKAVEKRNQTFVFRRNEYRDGYLCLKTEDFYPEAAIPTPDELRFFEHYIPDDFLRSTLEIMGARRLLLGQPVKVADGQAQGAVGIVESIVGDEAIVHISTDDVKLSLPLNALRKYIRIGDEVIVDAGPHAGMTGWVISVIEDTILVHDHKTMREAVVSSHAVSFYDPAFITRKSGPKKSPLEEELQTRQLKDDPLRRFIGKHVRIIGNNRWKDYKGFIKSTEVNEYLLVEIAATMRKERIHVSNLALLDDDKMTSLSSSSRMDPSNSTDASNHQRSEISPSLEIPPSSLPLARMPYTPVQSGSGTPSISVLSPAWDPSSRTPNSDPKCNFAYNPWMESPLLAGKRIRVQFRDTKAVLRDPGWKHGDHEGKLGIWTGIEGSSAKVSLGIQAPMLVPEKYVRPVRPSIKGQNVVIIGGEGTMITDTEYYIVTFGITECVARKRHGKPDPKDRTILATNALAVVL
ncbi:hypothetical protein D9615_009683 [Tricholomella constricta]|uniref:Chromatin elongation factor SPT5 n=1 Tax=Tricholomella constricta TaxID=117010 RepID=A0A8H5LVC4_9AGAR|nr:hypothetical protein D9615_009683 [Tricholomella constricta]